MRLYIIAAVGLLSATACAQTQEARRTFTGPGTFELGGSLAFHSTTQVSNGSTGDVVTTVSAFPFAGYFVVEGVEIVLNPLGVSYTSQPGRNTLDFLTLGGIAYNFRANARVFPFIEGLGGYAYSRDDNGGFIESRSGVAWGGRGGLKILVTGTGILNIGLQYIQVTLDRTIDTSRNGYNDISATAGFTVWL
jgi:hypothetical protein